MTTSSGPRKFSTTLTSAMAVGAVGVAGFGTVALYGTITAASAPHSSGTTSTTPDTSGSSSDGSTPDGSPGTQLLPGTQLVPGTQLLPGSGGYSHSQSSGS